MEVAEKRSLERKEFLLTNYLRWNPTLQCELLDDKLVEDEQIRKIKKAKDDPGRTKLLLEHMKQRGAGKCADRLADVLDDTRSSFIPDWINTWVADEIREELKAERNQLKISEELKFEVGQIVHREFGHEKRLSEFEKKTCVVMVSRVTQCSNNVWENQVNRTFDDSEGERALLRWKKDVSKTLEEKLINFVNDNKHRVTDREEYKRKLGHSTSRAFIDPAPERKQDPDKPLVVAKDTIQKAMGILSQSMLDVEILDGERDRVFHRVGIVKTGSTRMHNELEDAIKRTAEDLENAQDSIYRKEERYKEVLQELEDEKKRQAQLLASRDKNIEILMAEYNRIKPKLMEAEDKVKDLRRQVRHARAENQEMSEHYSFLECGDRLNFIVKRDAKTIRTPRGTQRKKSENDEMQNEDYVDADSIMMSESDLKKQFKIQKAANKEQQPAARRVRRPATAAPGPNKTSTPRSGHSDITPRNGRPVATPRHARPTDNLTKDTNDEDEEGNTMGAKPFKTAPKSGKGTRVAKTRSRPKTGI